jgi:hypothetical protein
MSKKIGGTPRKDTLCWDCQNYSRCSWAVGIPVKGWKATPTKIVDEYGDNIKTVDSFLVEACPHFKHDKKRRVLFKDIAKIIGKSERSAHRIKERKGIGRIKDLLAEKGYKLHVCKGDILCEYFLEKINDT